jgi:DNA primase catalytic core
MPDGDLGDFLDREVYPALFDRLDGTFREYGFRRRGNRWEATAEATRALPGSPRPERVCCYADRSWGLVIHGGDFVRFLDLVNGGTKPTGADFPEAVRKLADLAGVTMPERQASHEEAERHAKRHARQSALETVAALCREMLQSEGGARAREYLEGRGLDQQAQETLDLGLYPAAQIVERALREAGHDVNAARSEGLVFDRMAGYAIFPWADASGQPMTLYGRWPAKDAPDGRPKTLSLPGQGSKASPLYFDRARRAGHKDLVLVEGLVDAALLQAKGESNVIACMGASFSGSQLETLGRSNVRSVRICLDPDGAGETGTLACIRGLDEKGIGAYVAPVLPEGKDPDEYVLSRGLDAWRHHIGRAEHAFRYKARALVKTHMGEEWTDAALAACLDEAVAFDAAAAKDPERLTDLSQFFWPEIFEATGVDRDAISARREAARVKADTEREHVAYDKLLRDAGDKLRSGDLDATKELLRKETDRFRTQERHWKAEPIRSVADELDEHEEWLKQWRGKEFIGLPQRTLPTLDKLTLGLRGLMLLAAAPNAGKTALTVQLGLDTVVHNQDAAFLFVSLEMKRRETYTRLLSRLAGLTWRTVVLGSRLGDAPFADDEFDRLGQAYKTLRKLGPRLRILDGRNFPEPTLEKVLDQIENLKTSSRASRVFTLVDYLQVWPVTDAMAKTLRTDLDADKWRIGQMKELGDAVGSENPVLVISEARKPSNEAQEWAGDMAAVMGAARGTYTPDMVALLNPLSDDELVKLDGRTREQDAAEGFARQRLSIVKGRDGVQRGRVDLRFHFYHSRFEEI